MENERFKQIFVETLEKMTNGTSEGCFGFPTRKIPEEIFDILYEEAERLDLNDEYVVLLAQAYFIGKYAGIKEVRRPFDDSFDNIKIIN